jgi:hypothetical protein
MTKKSRLSLSLALGSASLLSFAALAAATPAVIDSSCSSSGDVCESILLSKKNGHIKFELVSATASVQGTYTLCVKGPPGKECQDFVLEQLPDEEIWADKVNWQKNFDYSNGGYTVKWKYMGDRIDKKLHFQIGEQQS